MAHRSNDAAIEMSGVSKSFGETRALDGLDLVVPAGTVYGLLGPNGAGKTTAVKVLATLHRPDGGHATVLGHDVVQDADQVRRRVSLTGQYASIDEDLTGLENLHMLARLLGYSRRDARSRGEQLLEAFGLAHAAGKQAKTYSGGMRRRLDIAASIVSTPELLFLDEPTTGLDPRSRNQVWDIVRAVVAGGTTVLLTTQYLDEADRLAGRIAVVDKGKAIAEGTPGELKASIGAGAFHARVRQDRRDEAALVLGRVLEAPELHDVDLGLVSARVPATDGAVTAAEWARRALVALEEADITVDEFSLGQPSLDEVFLALTDDWTDAKPSSTNVEEVSA